MISSRGRLFEPLNDAIRERLSNEQKERWDQLIVREWIENLGWPHILNQTVVKTWLKLDDDQVDRILKVAESLREEIRQETSDLEQKVYTKLLGAVSTTARRDIEKLIKLHRELAEPELDLLILHLATVSSMAHQQSAPDQGQKGRIRRDNPLVLGRALIASEPSLEPSRVGKWRIVRFPIDQIAYYDLVTDKLLFTKQVQQELLLLPYQTKKLNQLHLKKSAIVNKAYKGIVDSTTELMVGELQEPTTQEMLEVLLPHQEKALVEIILRRQIRMIGLPLLVLDGRFSSSPLEEKNRKEIVRRAAKLHEELKSARIRIANKVEKRFKKVLTGSQRRKLSSLIGQPIPFFVPSLDRIRLQLEMGDRDRVAYEEKLRGIE